jgi:catechol 2,3-dioxygenase-like lactoylglutathione lyase family enzyme
MYNMDMNPVRRLAFFTIYTADLDASRRFYVDTLGFALTKSTEEFFQIDCGGSPVCVDMDLHRRERGNIGVEVESIADVTAWLHQKQLEFERGTNSASSEDWVLIRDPDGNAIVFIAYQGEQPARRS